MIYLQKQQQTLVVTPATFTNLIWIPIIILHGCFIIASCYQHSKLKDSPLVGYDDNAVAAALTTTFSSNNNNGNDNNEQNTSMVSKVLLLLLQLHKQQQQQYSIAILQYPAVCIFSIVMIVSYDYGYMTVALLSSLLCGNILYNIVFQQRRLLCNQSSGLHREDEDDDDNDFYFDDFSLTGPQNSSVDATANAATANLSGDGVGSCGGGGRAEDGGDNGGNSKVVQYMTVRLPFELYAGYILSLCTVYLNAAIISNISMLPTWVYLLIANACLVGLLCVGCTLLWHGRVYGSGISLIWYLVSVISQQFIYVLTLCVSCILYLCLILGILSISYSSCCFIILI